MACNFSETFYRSQEIHETIATSRTHGSKQLILNITLCDMSLTVTSAQREIEPITTERFKFETINLPLLPIKFK